MIRRYRKRFWAAGISNQTHVIPGRAQREPGLTMWGYAPYLAITGHVSTLPLCPTT